ncbi:RagB/SusD family nutrient uptake outer membrane protein [Flavobacterium aquidurense]|uniref:RagB/SusD family nutrient uptake outer membrane protein n=1 Tax=Flavobacterium aquidurense TaxID=362413 RepID=UPI0009121C23|nr:RagB/SusD family nutrient uptake outer membrane protein [Flavobacterium aquidurense]OXA67767.1 RagB/SusD family nutrient uptake outer membrane protein [Flavobacterium aquidurense]SHH82356.1 Starch-binding associating with outer membrane [Flavobacterium frigidimaris]
MKTKKIIYKILLIALPLVWTSCSDLLDVEPEDRITKENFYKSESDFQAATGPLYNKVWFDFNDKFYYGLGDGRAANLYAPFSDYVYPFTDLTETGLTGPLVSAWGSLYNVVQQSNNVIIGITGSSVNDNIKNKYIAEARFMRGTAYWYLASLWGDVIISTDPRELVKNPIVNKNPLKDVYEFAMRDLEFAAKYLPETAGQSGRLTRYSAFGMLSRVYLSYSGISDNPNSGSRNQAYLDLAKKAAEKVINSGPYSLMPNYADLFMIENNNNSESMFALQWVPNGDFGVNNTQQAYFALSSDITGDDAAWGYWTRASYNVLQEYESKDSRRKATWMGNKDHYAEIGKANGGYTVDHTSDFLTVKKGVVGSTKDNAKITRMNSALNTYMLRLGEVYLNYAEAALGNNASTADALALSGINKLRVRAGLDPKATLTYADIIHERRVELCMEGQYWYDLVRRSYYKQQEVVNYVTSQNRGTITPILYDSATNAVTVDATKSSSSRAIGVIDATIFVLPYPESELVQNPLLRENPVPYQFTEERIKDLF